MKLAASEDEQSVEILTTTIVLMVFCMPAISVFFAAWAWRAALTSPRLFVVLGLSSLYLFAGYLATRPIPTHAIALRFDGLGAPEQDFFAPWLGLALLTLIKFAAASAAVLFLLRRLMSR